MLASLLFLVAHADDSATVQRLHELAWQRVDALNLAAQIPGADAPTRAEAAWALGRLRTPDALVVLEDLRSDRDIRVQVAVADALGWVPGGREVIRSWLDELGSPGLGRGARGLDRYGALVGALGNVGADADVPRMVAALREPWPVGAIAARGLAAMASRDVVAATEAAPALVSRLRGPDPRVVAAAARALALIGLGDAPSPSDVALVQDRIRRGTPPAVQASLIRAVWPALSTEARNSLFLSAATDTSRRLRVSSLSVLQAGDVPADVVSTFLADADPWIRRAAMRALARDLSPEGTAALRRQADVGSAHDAAVALQVLGLPDDARAADTDQPDVVRAALAGLSTSRRALEGWALQDPQPMVRSAAARRLLEQTSRGATVRRLLEASDPVVRWLAVEALRRAGAVGTIQRHLVGEADHRVLTAGIRALAEQPRRVARDRALPSVLLRASSSSSWALHQAGRALASGLQMPLPEGRPSMLPSVAEARTIRGAVVVTERGAFRLQLEPDLAPRAVAQFASLASAQFYDGLLVNAANPGRDVRTGCPRGDGLGDAGFVSPAEISAGPLRRGVVVMTPHPLGGVGSQWWVATGHVPTPGPHTRIGRVVDGQHVVDRLEAGDQVLSVTIERIPQ